MTKAFIARSDAQRVDHIRKMSTKEDINKTFEELMSGKFFMGETASLNDLKNDRLFRAATHLVRHSAVAYTNLIGSIISIATKDFLLGGGQDIFANSPIMVPVKGKPAEVYVFLNVIPDTLSLRELQAVSWASNANVLKTFYTEMSTQKASTSADAQKWATFKRGLKRIHKFEQMPLTRALARYTKVANKGWTETHIRDICAVYEEMSKPIELIWADNDPTKFWEMYKTGPASCMSPQPNSGGVSGVRPWLFLTEKNWHPTSIFAFSPHVKGVFFKAGKDGNVAARTMVYEKPGKKEFGRIYGANDRYANQLAGALRTLGYSPLNGLLEYAGLRGQAWHHKYTFEVPAFTGSDAVGNAPIMPIPYMDNHTVKLYVEYDEDRNVFIVECDGDRQSNINAQGTSGFVTSVQLEENKCHNCGHTLGMDKVVSQDGSGVFCTHQCAAGSGYILAIRDDGSTVTVPASQAIVDFHDNRKYTNEAAAARHGVLPFRPCLTEDNEEGDEVYTKQIGSPVLYKDEVFRLASAAFEAIPSSKRAKTKKVGHITAYVIDDSVTIDGPTLNIKGVKTVVVEENFTPWAPEEVNNAFNGI
jgi:hypothetical protein